MSGKWMRAARRFTGYDGVRRGQLTSTTPHAVRAVLQRIAERSNDAGVAAVYTSDLTRSVGLSDRAVKYAVAQLIADGWIWRAVRGQGSRAGDFRGTPGPSVYVLRPLPDASGTTFPTQDYLRPAWTRYALSAGYRARPDQQREAIRDAAANAWTPGLLPVDNSVRKARPTGKEGTTYGQPVAPSITSRRTTRRRAASYLRPVPDLVTDPQLLAQLDSRRPDHPLPDLTPFVWDTDQPFPEAIAR